VWRAIIDYPFNPSNFYPSARDIARDRFAARFTIAAYGGCTEEDVWDTNLDERDPEKSRFLWGTPTKQHPLALGAADDPLLVLRFAAHEMRLNGRKVTTTALARALSVSVATLYRRYGKGEIHRICQETPLRVLKPIRTRSELA
jgi:hypothetical protein